MVKVSHPEYDLSTGEYIVRGERKSGVASQGRSTLVHGKVREEFNTSTCGYNLIDERGNIVGSVPCSW